MWHANWNFSRTESTTKGTGAGRKRPGATAAMLSPPPPDESAMPRTINAINFARVYPLYIEKVEKKGRTKDEVDQVIRWLTGYSQDELEAQLEAGPDFETFFAEAPMLNPSRTLIKGLICGVRVEEIEEPTVQAARYLDKLVDELARGKAMDKVLRS